MKNLWPDNFSEPNELSPKQMLEEQAMLLGKITSGMVSAEVGPIHQDVAHRIFEVQNAFNFQLMIIGPFIDNYKHRVLRFSHGIPMYPVQVLLDDGVGKELGLKMTPHGAKTVIEGPSDFERLLESVLQTQRVRSIVGTILALSK